MPKHIKIGLFEAFETLGQALVRNLQDFLKHYGVTKKSLLMSMMKDLI